MEGGQGSSGTAGLLHKAKRFIKGMIVPDEQLFWIPPALQAAHKIFCEHKVDAIISTAPPFSAHLLGALLAKWHDIPLILDYRDLWGANPFFMSGGVKNACNGMLERFALRQASQVICTNSEAVQTMRSRFSFLSDRISLIENGFDADAIRSIISNKARPAGSAVRINYLGSLTKTRTPRPFLAAVKRFVEANPGRLLEIGFIGFCPVEHRQLVSDMGLDSFVTFYGMVPKETAMEMMCNHSDALLVLQRAGEGGATAIPGKLYEYLAAGKPVICLDEGLGATTGFLKSLGIEESVEYDDVEGIFQALYRVVTDYDVVAANALILRDKVALYDRKQLTLRLVDLLGKIKLKPKASGSTS